MIYRKITCLACMVLFSLALISCSGKNESLPFLGPKAANADGDTAYHSISPFSFIDQDGREVNFETFEGKIYVADFFFTTCPTICPKMKSQMLRVYEEYKDVPELMLLSHTIDPAHDSVAVLKDYAERLQVGPDTWRFVTGNKDDIFDIAQNSYFVSAVEDGAAPGGVIHSGRFVLVDKQKRIRGYYDGTKEESVDQLMDDIETLLNEK